MADGEKHPGQDWCEIHCANVFLPKDNAIKALWAFLAVMLTLVGSSVTYAITTSSQLSRVTILSEQASRDIVDLKGSQRGIDEKLTAILKILSEEGAK